MTAAKVEEFFSHVEALSTQDVKWELKKLRAIRDWALQRTGIDYQIGDTVGIVRVLNTDNGWAPYRDALAPGASATVTDIDFNTYTESWYADIILDREWSVSDYPPPDGKTYWHGKAIDTPEGYEPPSKYDQERHPEGRRHSFSVPVAFLAKVRP